MRWLTKGYGGVRVLRKRSNATAGASKACLLAVSVDDHHLSWPEREFIRQIGDKLYGNRAPGITNKTATSPAEMRLR
jgi:hypothetical protein